MVGWSLWSAKCGCIIMFGKRADGETVGCVGRQKMAEWLRWSAKNGRLVSVVGKMRLYYNVWKKGGRRNSRLRWSAKNGRVAKKWQSGRVGRQNAVVL